MQIVTSFVIGLIFGLGLILSGMTNPAKIIGFLDIFGKWDPSLLLVMFGAIIVTATSFHLTKHRKQSLLGQPLNVPSAGRIDHKLILGSLIFGAGWGLAGYCPGPSLVSILQGGYQPIVFVISMLVGMVFFEISTKRK
jgi:hypothetical protein